MMNAELKQALEESRAARAEALNFLALQGENINLEEWITIKEYCKRYNLSSTNVVSNWIKRGIVPKENIRTIEVLNNIRLIKAIPYANMEKSIAVN